jgi:hypothetical protein
MSNAFCRYKKDNHDKLNLEGLDQRQMEEYRNELDAQRDKILARGTNYGKKRKSRDGDSSSSKSDSDSRTRRKSKKSKKRHKRKRDRNHRRDHTADSTDDSRQGRKKKAKKEPQGNESDGSHYRLSNFFKQGSDDDE